MTSLTQSVQVPQPARGLRLAWPSGKTTAKERNKDRRWGGKEETEQKETIGTHTNEKEDRQAAYLAPMAYSEGEPLVRAHPMALAPRDSFYGQPCCRCEHLPQNFCGRILQREFLGGPMGQKLVQV